jgi:GTP pyrophosphokinase
MLGEFVVEVENLTHLNRVIGAVKRIKGVVKVERREQVDPDAAEA